MSGDIMDINIGPIHGIFFYLYNKPRAVASPSRLTGPAGMTPIWKIWTKICSVCLCIKFKQCSKKSDSICFSGSQVLAVKCGVVFEAKAGYIWLAWTENVGISCRSSIDRVVDGFNIYWVVCVLRVSELQFWDFFLSALCDRGDDWCWQSLSNQKLVSGRGWGVSSSLRKKGPLLSPDLAAATHTAQQRSCVY